MQDIANVTASLYRLIRKGARFQWDKACQSTSEDLKKAFVEAPVLSYLLDTHYCWGHQCGAATDEGWERTHSGLLQCQAQQAIAELLCPPWSCWLSWRDWAVWLVLSTTLATSTTKLEPHLNFGATTAQGRSLMLVVFFHLGQCLKYKF